MIPRNSRVTKKEKREILTERPRVLERDQEKEIVIERGRPRDRDRGN